MVLGGRILSLRKLAGLSQSELADKVGVSSAQIGRYETKGAQPPAEVLKKLADTLNTTVDYLISGDSSEKAKNTLRDSELLQYFKEVDNLADSDKNAIIRVISGYVRDCKTKQAYAS